MIIRTVLRFMAGDARKRADEGSASRCSASGDGASEGAVGRATCEEGECHGIVRRRPAAAVGSEPSQGVGIRHREVGQRRPGCALERGCCERRSSRDALLPGCYGSRPRRMRFDSVAIVTHGRGGRRAGAESERRTRREEAREREGAVGALGPETLGHVTVVHHVLGLHTRHHAERCEAPDISNT